MTPTTTALHLDRLGNVPPSYVHEWRVVEPVDELVLPDAVFKWYHVRREDVAVPVWLDAEARETLLASATRGDWSMEYGLNFALLHLSTEHAFLIAGVWRGQQELWERIYVKELAARGPFTEIERPGVDWPAACVWEMGVTCHERMAWHRYLFSERGNTDKVAWLADVYTGPA